MSEREGNKQKFLKRLLKLIFELLLSDLKPPLNIINKELKWSLEMKIHLFTSYYILLLLFPPARNGFAQKLSSLTGVWLGAVRRLTQVTRAKSF